MIKNGEIKTCPKCQAPTFKYEGCNFMTCSSSACNGKTFFCYICESELTKT
jgi:hypothetical protein